MNSAQIKEQFRTGRLLLNKWEILQHYSFVLIALLYPMLVLYDTIFKESQIIHNLYLVVAFLLIAAYLIYYQYKALEFGKFRLPHTPENFKAAIVATTIELEWEHITVGKHFIEARKIDLLSQWDGLRITILSQGEKLYANSIVEPSLRSNPFSDKLNKKNIQVFNNYLLLSTRGDDVVGIAKEKVQTRIDRLKSEPVWSAKNIFKRTIGYSLAILLIGVLVFILIEEFSFHNLLIAALPMLICSIYIYDDLRSIFRKNEGRE